MEWNTLTIRQPCLPLTFNKQCLLIINFSITESETVVEICDWCDLTLNSFNFSYHCCSFKLTMAILKTWMQLWQKWKSKSTSQWWVMKHVFCWQVPHPVARCAVFSFGQAEENTRERTHMEELHCFTCTVCWIVCFLDCERKIIRVFKRDILNLSTVCVNWAIYLKGKSHDSL